MQAVLPMPAICVSGVAAPALEPKTARVQIQPMEGERADEPPGAGPQQPARTLPLNSAFLRCRALGPGPLPGQLRLDRGCRWISSFPPSDRFPAGRSWERIPCANGLASPLAGHWQRCDPHLDPA